MALTISSVECDDDIADQFAALDRLMGVGDAIQWEAGGDAVLEIQIGQQLPGHGDRLYADGRWQVVDDEKGQLDAVDQPGAERQLGRPRPCCERPVSEPSRPPGSASDSSSPPSHPPSAPITSPTLDMLRNRTIPL